jgi:hypothetical protein
MNNNTLLIAGIGAGGSALCQLACKKFGPDEVVVVDFDDVEEKNCKSQIYEMDNIGLPKASALSRMFCRRTVSPLHGTIQDVWSEVPRCGWWHMGMDNLEGRLFMAEKALIEDPELVTDIRLLRTHYEVYLYVRGTYDKLVANIEADIKMEGEVVETGEEVSCTTDSGFYASAFAASLVVHVVDLFNKGDKSNRVIIGDIGDLL